MIRLGLLTTLWRRPELTRIVLRHHANLAPSGVEIVPVAVGSEKGAKEMCEEEGWTFIRHKNSPLSDKHNAGLRAFQGAGVDGVAIIGSDNLLNAAYFEEMASRLAQGHEVVELRGIYFYDLFRDDLVYADAWSTGVGRVFSRALLRRRGWEAWERGVDRRVDSAAQRQLLQWANPRSWVPDLRATDIRVVDIKTDTNMWSFDWAVREVTRPDRRHPVPNSQGWFERHFPGTWDDLTAIPQPANPTTT